jgi:hypothetical protein
MESLNLLTPRSHSRLQLEDDVLADLISAQAAYQSCPPEVRPQAVRRYMLLLGKFTNLVLENEAQETHEAIRAFLA